MDVRILRYDTLDSTNTEAANHARKGAGEGLCIVADEQTGGKGRQGRSWISERGGGVYLSIVLRPRLDAKHLSLIPLMAGVAVNDILQKGFLIDADIKWPNDILVNDKKICGILAEAVETPDGVAIILGIGINLRTPESENATSIAAESQFAPDRNEIVRVLVEDIAGLYERLHSEPSEIIQMWSERSTYFEGKQVEVALFDRVIRGTTAGLEETGALRLKLSDGSMTVVHAGDVTRLRKEVN